MQIAVDYVTQQGERVDNAGSLTDSGLLLRDDSRPSRCTRRIEDQCSVDTASQLPWAQRSGLWWAWRLQWLVGWLLVLVTPALLSVRPQAQRTSRGVTSAKLEPFQSTSADRPEIRR